MTKAVRLPRLLDANMNEVSRLNPSGLSISLTSTPVSTADMSVELNDTPIPMRSWIELYTIHGSAGVFRVSQSDLDYDSCEQRLALEHGLCALNDAIMTGEDEEEKTPSQWLSAILNKQSTKAGGKNLWNAGTVEATASVFLTPGGSTLLTVLSQMMEQLPDYVISTDQTVFPWKLSIVKKSAAVQAEGRLSRNLSTCRVSYDDSDLCTRVYANGIVKGYLDADADTVDKYGVVEQYLMLDENTEHADAIRLAKAYLKKRKEPAISVELDAVDLSLATGESLDAFTLNKRFRLAIPAYGVTVEQWITGIDYGDVYGDPEHMTVTLANEVADLAQRMAKVEVTAQEADYKSDSNSRRIGATTRTLVKHGTKLEKTDSYLKFLDDEGVTVWRDTSASVEVGDALAAMKAQVTDTYGNIFTKDDIVQKMRAAGVTVDATKSLVEIYATEQIKTSEGITNHETRITANENGLTSTVKKGSVISSINQSAEKVQIKASKIELDGYVEGILADIDYISVGQLAVGDSGFSCSSYVTLFGYNAEWKSSDVVYSYSYTSSKYHFQLKDGSSVYLSPVISCSKRTIHYLGKVNEDY